MDDLYAWWGERLRDRRIELGIGQVELAAKADTTQSTISRIERGAGAPGDAMKYRLAAALQTSVKDLFPYPPDLFRPSPVTKAAAV